MNGTKHTEFLEICRKYGWKCTPQRMAVYEYVRGNLTHPDVDAVWAGVRFSLPSVTRESVYRILNEFSDRGMIRRLDRIESARYDSRTDLHGHFICRRCGRITDFEWPEGVALPLESETGKAEHMELRLIGICRRCSAGAGGTPEWNENLNGCTPIDPSENNPPNN